MAVFYERGGIMQELENILEEIIEQLKEEGCIIDDAAGNRAEEIVRQHMNDNSICADCSRRKWYQKGYEDGKNNNDGWIPVDERLPEEKVSPVTRDFYEYQVTANFGFGEDVITYKYGNGHWWHGPGIVDEYVIAWRQKPDPYRPERSRK